MIRREEARLRSVFQRLLLLSAAASPTACSGGASPEATDASVGTNEVDATVDAPATGSSDGGGGGLDGTAPSDAAVKDSAPPGDATDPYGFTDSACDPEYIDGEADGSGCDFFERLPCGIPPGAPTDGCYLLVSQCGTLCNQVPNLARVCAVAECLVENDASTIPSTTPLTLDCATGQGGCVGVGRRPRGLVDPRPHPCADAVGGVLAEMAHLEAASVHAFRRLGAELASMGAPRSLIRQAKRSATDEVRHARVTSRLARARGAKPASVVIDRRRPARTIEDFAVENAVEGCVRETFGALVAMRQAACARDREIARDMRRIARDETRHAALAWEIARWLAPRLDAAGRMKVRRAVAGAIARLGCESAWTPAAVAHQLGLATGAEGMQLVEAFALALFPPLTASARPTRRQAAHRPGSNTRPA